VLEELNRLKRDGVEAVLAEPIGFVSDHLEILWDLDVEARERAAELGLEWARTASLNDEPAFVKALAGIVRKATTVRSAA
jgi:ferrochelatase